jgi:hypothetical protein
MLVGAFLAPVQRDDEWTSVFRIEGDSMLTTGRNPYFILEPGYRLELAGGNRQLVITVMDETPEVNGVETRVVEERESVSGALVEVSRNYYAISQRTNSVFCFGQVIEQYKDGKITGQKGSWTAGHNSARFGMIMPGIPLLQARYYQEISLGVAQDRSEIVGLSETVTTPAGEFQRAVKVRETTPLVPAQREYKYYAWGVGLIQDGELRLVKAGKP